MQTTGSPVISLRGMGMFRLSEEARGNARPQTYVNYLTCLFFLAYGFIMLDAGGAPYFLDVLMSELHITAAQYAALNAVVWCAKALSSVVAGIVMDRTGLRKRLLAPLLIAAGMFSISTCFATSYAMLIILRFLCGCCIGPTLTIAVSIVAKNLMRDDLGTRSGIISAGSAVIASAFGPMILTRVAVRHTWRGAYLLTGGLVLAAGILALLSVKEVRCEKLVPANKEAGIFIPALRKLFRERAFVICLIIGIFECAGKLTMSVFGPLYLIDIMGVET